MSELDLDPESPAARLIAAADALQAATAEALRMSEVYARAKAHVDAYRGRFHGEAFEARINAWRAATLAYDRAAAVYRVARIDHYLANRRFHRAVED